MFRRSVRGIVFSGFFILVFYFVLTPAAEVGAAVAAIAHITSTPCFWTRFLRVT